MKKITNQTSKRLVLKKSTVDHLTGSQLATLKGGLIPQIQHQSYPETVFCRTKDPQNCDKETVFKCGQLPVVNPIVDK